MRHLIDVNLIRGETKMEMKPVKVMLVLTNGDRISGFVNIMEYKRFSDFIESSSLKHIKLFNAAVEENAQNTIVNFILIPKKNILYYQPYDEESVNKIDT